MLSPKSQRNRLTSTYNLGLSHLACLWMKQNKSVNDILSLLLYLLLYRYMKSYKFGMLTVRSTLTINEGGRYYLWIAQLLYLLNLVWKSRKCFLKQDIVDNPEMPNCQGWEIIFTLCRFFVFYEYSIWIPTERMEASLL